VAVTILFKISYLVDVSKIKRIITIKI
jgi:hypothetical protein